jgi:propanediol dehydratase small subunit
LPNELDEVTLAERLDRVAHDDRLRVTVEALTSQCDADRGVRAAADRVETLADAAISV